eukprot:14144597-Alexandrium_andersonii.AAC.1
MPRGIDKACHGPSRCESIRIQGWSSSSGAFDGVETHDSEEHGVCLQGCVSCKRMSGKLPESFRRSSGELPESLSLIHI